MRALIDACALYPTVVRALWLELAAEGVVEPLWSARLLEEWARVAERRGEGALARAEIARLRAARPEAEVPAAPGREAELAARFDLPDPGDLHVLAAALEGGAEVLVTFNLRDFPRRAMAALGLPARHPDTAAMQLFAADADAVTRAAGRVHAEAERLSGRPWPVRALWRKARLPRLGKALAPGQDG